MGFLLDSGGEDCASSTTVGPACGHDGVFACVCVFARRCVLIGRKEWVRMCERAPRNTHYGCVER